MLAKNYPNTAFVYLDDCSYTEPKESKKSKPKALI